MNKEEILEFVVPAPKMDLLNQIIQVIKSLEGVLDVSEGAGTNRVLLNITISDTADRKGLYSFISHIVND